MHSKSRSSTTTSVLPNPHPGEILLEEFLKPMGLSQTALANAIGVPPRRINEIVLGKRAVTADTDLRLARYFGVSAQFWMNLQARYDLAVAEDQLGRRLESEVITIAESPARYNRRSGVPSPPRGEG